MIVERTRDCLAGGVVACGGFGVTDMPDKSIPLSDPVKYAGKEFNRVSLNGSPFPEVTSVFESLKQQVTEGFGLRALYEGNPRIPKIESYTLKDLKIEAYAYAIRAKRKGNPKSIHSDPKGAVKDVDSFRSIFWVVLNQSCDDDLESKARVELELSSIALRRSARSAGKRSYMHVPISSDSSFPNALAAVWFSARMVPSVSNSSARSVEAFRRTWGGTWTSWRSLPDPPPRCSASSSRTRRRSLSSSVSGFGDDSLPFIPSPFLSP